MSWSGRVVVRVPGDMEEGRDDGAVVGCTKKSVCLSTFLQCY